MNLKMRRMILATLTVVFLVSCSTQKITSEKQDTLKSEIRTEDKSISELSPKVIFLKSPSNTLTELSYLSDKNFTGNKVISSFSSAKNILKSKSFFGIQSELYCGCEFSGTTIPKNAKCGIKPRNNTNAKRTFKIEFEHIIPFENQTGHTLAYKEGVSLCKGKLKRACASKAFAHLEADLWNLWPASGEMNGDRSNHPYGVFTGERNQYGKCDFRYEKTGVEPRNEVKALIAFTYIYYQKTYSKFLSINFITEENRKMITSWSKYPLSKEQCRWAVGVYKTQLNRNDDLLKACEPIL